MAGRGPKGRQGPQRKTGLPRADRAPEDRQPPRTDRGPEDRQGPQGQTGAPRTGRGPEDRQGHEDRQGL